MAGTKDPRFKEIGYSDELLADNSVCRRYEDGRIEWRKRGTAGTVEWRDNRNRKGVDEPLDSHVIKRTVEGSKTLYGREQGFGRTAWSDFTLTTNQTSLGGRAGKALSAVTAGALPAALVLPPMFMTSGEEEQLRQARQSSSSSSSGDGGGGSSSDSGSYSDEEAPDGDDGPGDGSWDSGDGGGDDDFG